MNDLKVIYAKYESDEIKRTEELERFIKFSLKNNLLLGVKPIN